MSQDNVIMPPPNYLLPPSLPLTAPVPTIVPQLHGHQQDDQDNNSDRAFLELNPSNKTIYINNLEERIPLQEMKQTLTNEFSQYGKILDLILKRNIKMRGQAFIIFQELSSAEKAIKEKQGQQLYNKEMRINFAKTKSDIIAKIEGVPIERNRNNKSLEDFLKKPEKKIKIDQDAQQSQQQSQQPLSKVQQSLPRNVQKPTVIVPNNILFIENLPTVISEEYLTELFKPYPGFKEVRLISNKAVAFAEFEDEYQAGMACTGLVGTKLTPDYNLQVSYAKK